MLELRGWIWPWRSMQHCIFQFSSTPHNISMHSSCKISSSFLNRLIITCSTLDPWRDEDGRNSDPEPVKPEVIWLWTNNIIWAGDTGDGGGHVIVKATMFIIYNYEQDVVPLGTRSQCLINVLDKFLALGNIMGGVIIVRRQELGVEIALFDYDIVRKLPLLAVPLEI